MAKNTTNTAIDETATMNAVTANFIAENNNTEDKKETTKTKKRQTVTRQSVTLEDSEEIQIISLIPHVSYLDKRTQDMYEWEEVGHIEYMTVETLKDMWRNNKGYFRNLWLKPMDERVLVKFGLVKIFESYEFLMDESSYTKDNIDKLTSAIAKAPIGMKFAIVNKIKQLVSDGTISDVSVIKALGRKLDTNFLVFI